MIDTITATATMPRMRYLRVNKTRRKSTTVGALPVCPGCTGGAVKTGTAAVLGGASTVFGLYKTALKPLWTEPLGWLRNPDQEWCFVGWRRPASAVGATAPCVAAPKQGR